MDQPGGAVEQSSLVAPALSTPKIVWQRQAEATPLGYRKAAIKDGMRHRKSGLFPPGDPLLRMLADDPDCHPFDKHLAGLESCYERLPNDGWVSGNAAASHGVDLRLFFRDAEGYEEHGSVVGAVRLGEKASIGTGYWMNAHGGAIESILDEATAELVKCEFSPTMGTTEVTFKLKKPVPLNTTLRVNCEITNVKGARCWVTGSITDLKGNMLASCEVLATDIRGIAQAAADNATQ